MEKCFSPVGLKVLVVDDDPTWLKILEKMLKKCSYEVTTCGLAREALKLLRERKDGYDIVISDVNMPDMDGFKLLEHVGLELDLPVIMMSVDGETSRVMKGVQHGACDYLLKPIRMKELKIIWQHVLRKKLQEVRDIEGCCYEGGADWIIRYDEGGEEVSFGKKRKDFDFEKKLLHDENNPSSKKARVVWSVELHQKFVNAVNEIGCDHKAGPKKILDLMNVPWLPRENVASHLQKYKLYLSRLEKDKELKSTDSPPQDAGLSLSQHSPGKSRYARENDPKTLLSEFNTDVSIPLKANKTRIGFDPPISTTVFESLLESKPPILYESNSFLQQQSSYVANSDSSLMEEEMKPSYDSSGRSTCVNANEFPMAQYKSDTVTLQDFDWELPESHNSGSLDNDLDLSWLQGELNLQFQDYSSSQTLLSELSPYLWFGNEWLPDPDDYSLIVDQGLFIS